MAYKLQIYISPASSGSVQPTPTGNYVGPGAMEYAEGTVVSLRALPALNLGYLDHWEGDVSGSAEVVTVTMNSNKTVTAVFGSYSEDLVQLTTDVIGNGSVLPSEGTFDKGSQVILVAYPGAGQTLLGWGGDIQGADYIGTDKIRITMDRDKNIVVKFEEPPEEPPPPSDVYYSLETEVSPANGGAITRNPQANAYMEGTYVTLTAVPTTGYRFEAWAGDVDDRNSSITIFMERDTYVIARFKKTTVIEDKNLVTEVIPAGAGQVTREPYMNLYPTGTEVTLEAVANEGYKFSAWTGDISGTGSVKVITMNTDLYVIARFELVSAGEAEHWHVIGTAIRRTVKSSGVELEHWHVIGTAIRRTVKAGEVELDKMPWHVIGDSVSVVLRAAPPGEGEVPPEEGEGGGFPWLIAGVVAGGAALLALLTGEKKKTK